MTKCPNTPEPDPSPDYFSPSQIESFELCQRKWGWRILDRVKAPPNPFAAFGIEVHDQHKGYLLSGVPYDLTTKAGECALASLHHLPSPGTPGLKIEEPFWMSAWGHTIHGIKDVAYTRIVGEQHLPNTAPIVDYMDPMRGQRISVIMDHKTTGNLRWAKTSDELLTHPQSVLYAAHAMVSDNTEACDLRWVYTVRHEPYKTQPVDLRVYKESLAPALERIKTTIDEMASIKAAGVKTKDLPPNPKACSAFGGCPYIRHCNLSPQQEIIGFMTQPTTQSDFLARVRATVANNGGAGAAINPPPVGAVPQNGAPPQGPPAWAQQAPQAPPPVQAQAPQGPPSWAQPGAPPVQAQAQQAPQGPPAGWSPPPPVAPQINESVLAQARQRHPNWEPGQPWWDGAQFINPDNPTYPPVFMSPQGPPPGAPQPQGAAPAQEEKPAARRGRPPGSKNKNAQGTESEPDIPADANPMTLIAEGLDLQHTGIVLLKQGLMKLFGQQS